MGAEVIDRKFFVAGDRARATAQTLVDANGNAVDLTGQSVRWELWTVDDGTIVFSTNAAIDTPADGEVSHEFTADEAAYLVLHPGEYHERWIRVDASDREERFPTHGVISIWFKRKPGT